MTVVPLPPLPVPLPGLQGFKEHIYGIQNRFKEPRLFILALPKEYREFQEKLGLEWFAVEGEGEQERIPLQVLDDPLPHIPFELGPEEETQFLLRVELSPEIPIEEGIKLPCEIWVQGEWPEDARPLMYEVDWPKFAPIAGFTIVLETGVSTLQGTVLDPEGKPLLEVRVQLQTVNKLQGAEVWTDGKGNFAFPEINPDVYHIWAEGEEWRSEAQVVVLLSDREEQVVPYAKPPKGVCISEIGGLELYFDALPYPDGPLPNVFVFEGVTFKTIWNTIRKERQALWCYGGEKGNDATVELDFGNLSHAVYMIKAEVHGHGPDACLEGYQLGGQTQKAVCPGDQQVLRLEASPGNPFKSARLSGQEAEWSAVVLG